MKKYLIIIVLCAALSACSTHTSAISQDSTLLSYADLANEITVDYEDMVGRSNASRTADQSIDSP